jgi:hypothetical protein
MYDTGDAIAKMYQMRQAMEKAGVSGSLFDKAKEKILEKNNGDHMATLGELSDRFNAFLTSLGE